MEKERVKREEGSRKQREYADESGSEREGCPSARREKKKRLLTVAGGRIRTRGAPWEQLVGEGSTRAAGKRKMLEG